MTQHHGETERRAQGFEARLEVLYERVVANPIPYVSGVVGLLLVGLVAALVSEWRDQSQQTAQLALEQVEWRYLEGMGGTRGDLYVVEPANEDQAREARERALAGYEQVIAEHGGVTREAAQMRAAEIEIDMGRLVAAQERLQIAADDMAGDSVLRAAALRLRGYVLEELGRLEEAAAAYEEAGGVESYPAREALWLAAGDTYLRAGDLEGAAAAYREILGIAPAFAEREGLVERLAGLEALSEDGAPAESPGG